MSHTAVILDTESILQFIISFGGDTKNHGYDHPQNTWVQLLWKNS